MAAKSSVPSVLRTAATLASKTFRTSSGTCSPSLTDSWMLFTAGMMFWARSILKSWNPLKPSARQKRMTVGSLTRACSASSLSDSWMTSSACSRTWSPTFSSELRSLP